MRAEDRWEAPGAEPQQAFPQETHAKRPFVHLKRLLGLQGKALACQRLLPEPAARVSPRACEGRRAQPPFAAGAPRALERVQSPHRGDSGGRSLCTPGGSPWTVSTAGGAESSGELSVWTRQAALQLELKVWEEQAWRGPAGPL